MKKIFLWGLAWMLCNYTYAGDPIPETIHAYKNYIQRELSSIEGWCSKEKALAMFDLIIKENPKICIDILHIDGNHSEEPSFLDVVTYYPKVKSDGYIWFDDIKRFPSTQRAVDYLYKHCTCARTVDNSNCILFQKLY